MLEQTDGQRQIILDHMKQLQEKLNKPQLSLMDIQMMRMMIQKLEALGDADPQIAPLIASARHRIAQRMTA